MQLQSTHPSSFVLLADPEFSKLTELTAGLDFAFPAANKIGEHGWLGVLTRSGERRNVAVVAAVAMLVGQRRGVGHA